MERIYEIRRGHLNALSASLDLPAESTLVSRVVLATRGVMFDNGTVTSAPSLFEYHLIPGALEELLELARLENCFQELYCHTSDSRVSNLAYHARRYGIVLRELEPSVSTPQRPIRPTELLQWGSIVLSASSAKTRALGPRDSIHHARS